MLEVDQGHTLHYVGDYGTTHVTTPAPEPMRDSAGTISYRARTEAHDLTVVIREAVCHDAMNGQRFSHTVTVRLDGREVAGCGRTLTGTATATNGANTRD